MLARSVRASRSSIARIARQQQADVSRRTFIIPTAIRQVDLVQDLYIKELKSYKSIPIKASDAEGSVQKWSTPAPPKSPEEEELASGLKAYEEQQVEVEGQANPGETHVKEEDWFEEEEEHGSGH
ncbi:hypothetical protein GP486_005653 [Trichoglossum hirsutum]|uniref:Mitochondrial F1F0 ATP synthase subunit Atp14 n=1 Tax=Trichoglossum hirsutum TaxID=265104 RepID=A0A9P8L8U6_9PEZI|nr:hypothetical protein GP486_005653 [Trichoglossum hirsutum]